MKNIKEQHDIKFFEQTTMEELEVNGFLSSRSVFLKFGDNVLLGTMNWRNEYVGAIYEFKFYEREVKRNFGTRRLDLKKISEETFEDAGHAVEWAMKNI